MKQWIVGKIPEGHIKLAFHVKYRQDIGAVTVCDDTSFYLTSVKIESKTQSLVVNGQKKRS